MAVRLASLDTETHNIIPGLLAPPLVCVSFAHRTEAGTFQTGLLNAQQGADLAASLLADENTVLVFHNAAFDLAVICAARPELIKVVFAALKAGRIRDTKIRQELLDIYEGRKQKNGHTLVFRAGQWQRADYSLAGLVKLYGGRDRTAEKKAKDAWRRRFATLENLPVAEWPAEATEYVLADATDPLEVYEAQGRAAAELDYLDPDYPCRAIVDEVAQVQAAWALHLMSCWGVRTDAARVAELERVLLAEQAKNRETLAKAKFTVPRPATAEERREGKIDFYQDAGKGPRAMRWKADKKAIAAYVERVYARRGLPAPRTEPSERYPEGQIATDKDTLYESKSRLLALVADGGGVDKLLTTYIPVLKQGTTTPINVRYNVLVNSGRTSSYGEKDKETGDVSGCNIQNLPTGRRKGGVRECFIPRPGYLFVSVDYETHELRALAQICLWLFKRSRLAEVINSGQDVHSAMAAEMIGVTYEQIERNKKIKGSPEKLARDAAKVADFGLPGGLGIESLVEYARVGYKVTLTKQQAADLKRYWQQMWPEMGQYFAYINAKVGLIEGRLRQFFSGRVRGAVGYCDGCNTLFQGLAADGAKRALFRIAYEMYCDESSPLYGSRLAAFIHDEFLAEVPEDRAHAASYRLTEIAIEEMQKVTPDVRITASPALMRRWYKDAAERHDATGQLIPWEPDAAA